MLTLLTLSKKFFLYLVLFLIIAIGVLAGVYMATNSRASEALLDETSERQLALTKTGSIVISEFFNITGQAVLLVSQNYQLLNSKTDRHVLLNDFVTRRKDTPIVGIAVVNESGIVTDNHTYNEQTGQAERNGPAQGVNLSDRDYVKWASSAQPGQVHISSPVVSRLGASKGKEIVTISTPLFEQGRYSGAIIVPVLLEDFKSLYLDVFDQKTATVYILNDQGTILFSPNEENVGKDIFELSDNPLFDVSYYRQLFNESLQTNQPGSVDIFVPSLTDKKLTRNIVTYAPISGFNNNTQKWMLVMSAPVHATLSSIAPVYIQQISLLIAIFFALLFIVLTVAKVIHIKE